MANKHSVWLKTLGIALAMSSLVPATEVLADARTEARRHFRRGMELVVEGRTDEGVAELEQAYEILPHPNVLYNIGRAYAEAGRYDEALEYFEQYLGSDPPDREEVRAIVTAINQRIEARQLAEAEAQARTTQQGEQAAGTQAAGAGPALTTQASAEQIAAIRESATQIATLAEVAQSDALRQRATRLNELAAALEASAQQPAGGAGQGGGAVTTTTTVSPAGEGGARGEVPVGTGAGAETLTVAAAEGGAYEETVVSASRQAQSPLDAPASTTIITRQDIRLSGVVHVGELLRRAAGVQVMNVTAADTDIGIRGFNRLLSPRVLMLINGRSTYIDALGITLWDAQAISVEDIERIEIIRGPASALYGQNGFSGIVNIITRQPGEEPGTEMSFGVGNDAQVRGHVATSGRVGSLGYRFFGGYRQYNMFTLFYSPDRVDLSYPVPDPAIANRSVQAGGQLTYRLGRHARLNAEGGVTYNDQFNFYGTGGLTDFYVKGPLSYVMASLNSDWGRVRTWWNHLDVSANQYDGRVPPQTLQTDTVDVEAEFARRFDGKISNHDFHLGANYRFRSADWTIFTQVERENFYAFFLEDTIKFSDFFRIVGSLRMDKHPLIDHPVWSPRGAIILRPTEGQSIRLTAGSAFRTPAMLETYVQYLLPSPVSAVGALGFGSTNSTRAFGTPPLKPERILSIETGYQNQESDYFSFEISAYYNRVTDLIALSNQSAPFTLGQYGDPNLAGITGFDAGTNQFPFGASRLTNDVDVYNVFGGEVGVRVFPVDGLDVYTNYSLNQTFADVPGQSSWERDERTSQHQFNLGVQYRSRFGLDIGADFHYYSPQVWPELQVTASGINRVQLPLDSYQVLNARIGYRVLNDKLEFGLAGYNLTGSNHRQHPYGQQLQTRILATVAARF